ncbi:hypothetical protein Sbs19_24300 [Sphingobium sp. BS19]|nr:hypothetical protein Sbs19_24300 [Sphingobium sp. BS19]
MLLNDLRLTPFAATAPFAPLHLHAAIGTHLSAPIRAFLPCALLVLLLLRTWVDLLALFHALLTHFAAAPTPTIIIATLGIGRSNRA